VEVGCQDLIGLIQMGSPCLVADGVLIYDTCCLITSLSVNLFFFH
jgi:hypothetical protein